MPPKKETPYPDKPPIYKAKALKIDSPAYADSLGNAYKTTRDVSKELKDEIDPFVAKAKARVKQLIDIIQVLRKELREAKDALVLANRDNLHPALLQMEGDPMSWEMGEENKEAS